MSVFSKDFSRLASAHLRILATSDIHMQMTGWDARQDSMTKGAGLDQLAISLRKARDGSPGESVLLDNGDTLQGTAEGDHCARFESATLHPWPAIANVLGYDAIGLGNHDFDYGLKFLERIIGQLNAPVLCSSLSSGTLEGARHTAILKKTMTCSDGVERPVSIGIFSVLPPQTLMWNHSNLTGRLAFDDGLTAAHRAVATLKSNSADLIVALCHTGLSTQNDQEAENFAIQLAQDVPNIDAMIMGHTHLRFPDTSKDNNRTVNNKNATIAGVPAAMPDFAAQSLAIIDLELAWSGETWQVLDHSISLSPAAQGETDPVITGLAAPSIAATKKVLGTPISTTEHVIHSFFNALQSGTEHALVARAMTRTITDVVTGTDFGVLPVIASVSSSAVGGHRGGDNFIHVPKGDILERHIGMMCPYHNDIWAAVLTGADLRNWAERSAAHFAPKIGEVSPLVNPDAPFFNFDSLVGLETHIDPFQPSRFDTSGRVLNPDSARITALTYSGKEVLAGAKFLVAMTSYRGAGGGAFPGLANSEKILRAEMDMAAALRTELTAGPVGPVPAATAWRFKTGLNHDVTIETSPRAIRHLDDISHFDPQPIGLTESGFLQIKVTI